MLRVCSGSCCSVEAPSHAISESCAADLSEEIATTLFAGEDEEGDAEETEKR